MPTTYEYEKPQVKVYQEFDEIPTTGVGNQPVFVFGPSFQLYRYNDTDEHDFTQILDDLGPVSYDGNGGTYSYPNGSSGVDYNWRNMKVFMENAVVNIGSITAELYEGTNSPISNRYVFDPGATYLLIAAMTGSTRCPVQVGDRVINENISILALYNNVDAETRADYPYVAKLSATVTSLDTADDAEDNAEDNTAHSSADDDGTDEGGADDDGTDDGGADDGGTDEADEDTASTVQVYLVLGSVEIPLENGGTPNWSATGSKITVLPNITIPSRTTSLDSTHGVVKSATGVFVQYRYETEDLANGIDHIVNMSEIPGQVSPDNPLAYGIYMARLNSGECPVYYMATRGTDPEDYGRVLGQASLTDDIYMLVPVFTAETASGVHAEVLERVQAHVNEMSAPETKRWRIAFISEWYDATKVLFTASDNKRVKAKSNEYYGQIVDFVTQDGDIDGSVKGLENIAAGDALTIAFTEDQSIEQKTVHVTHVLTDQRITVDAQLDVSKTYDVVELVHTYTSYEQAERIAASSRNYSDRRLYNVFPQSFQKAVNGEQHTVDGCFLAAAVAGLASSTLPQQPLTNMAINGIDDVPETYSEYDNTELNIMAAGGTFIVAQDMPLDKVYVRHQLSTATSDGNLLTRELSITKNVDSISYYLAASCDDYIGKYNITPELIDIVYNTLVTALTVLESNGSNSLYGPQLLVEGTEIVSVAEHPSLADHIQAFIRIRPPKPFNTLEIYLTVI